MRRRAAFAERAREKGKAHQRMAKDPKHDPRARHSSAVGPNSRLGLASYCVYATDFFRAARSASATSGAGFSPARLFLVCHALELTLKAYRGLRGQRPDETATAGIKPDLGRLLTTADSFELSELVRLTPEQRVQIRKAALYYSEGVFEYPALAEALRGYPQAPDVNVLLCALAEMVAAVCDASLAAM